MSRSAKMFLAAASATLFALAAGRELVSAQATTASCWAACDKQLYECLDKTYYPDWECNQAWGACTWFCDRGAFVKS